MVRPWHRVAIFAIGALLAGLSPARPALAATEAPLRQVTDMAGRQVAVPARLERIASVGGSPAVNAFLFLFGWGDRIVTGLPPAFAGDAWRWQRRFAPGLVGKAVVSGPPPAWTPNLESLLTLQPDLSLVVSSQAAQQVERAGLPALVLNWDKADSIQQTVKLLAEVSGKQQRAQDYFAWEKGLLAKVDSRLQDIAPAARPRVLYFRYSSLTQPIMTPANQLIARAGGHSVTADSNPLRLDVFPFSVEQVLAWQPEVILLAFAGELPALLADPRFAQLPAVRNKRIHAVPHGAHIWTHYTPEQPLGVLWLAKLLYPERLADIDPVAESRSFYQRFFATSLSDAEVRQILTAAPVVKP